MAAWIGRGGKGAGRTGGVSESESSCVGDNAARVASGGVGNGLLGKHLRFNPAGILRCSAYLCRCP